MSPSIFIRRKAAVAASFTAALGLVLLWEAVPARASMMIATQAIRSTDAPSNTITPIRCQKEHCYLPQQYMRPGFDPKKERPLGGTGKQGSSVEWQEKAIKKRNEEVHRERLKCVMSGRC